MAMDADKGGAPPEIASIVDVGAYPLGDAEGDRVQALVAQKRRELDEKGTFGLEGFLRPEAVAAGVAELEPLVRQGSFHHAKTHNVYFTDDDPPPLRARGASPRLTSSQHTLTGDQLAGTVIRRVYEWDPLRDFLAAVMNKPHLFRMADPLACVNVMGYGSGDQIGWHFDRAEFTVTLLFQEAAAGGTFEYRHNLRSEDDPNYSGVARLLADRDSEVRSLALKPGTLNVFAGYRSVHRVTSVAGDRRRIMAVLSYMEEPDVQFSRTDRLRFYGRAEPLSGLASKAAVGLSR